MKTSLFGKYFLEYFHNSSRDVTATSRVLVRPANLLAAAMLVALPVSLQAQDTIVAGANVNMVSGTEFPGGDPFLQRQNEPSLAVSTRNPLHLLGGANDYRTVDVPGLTDGKAVGDSWHGIYTSINGGGSWVSTLIPGFEQDNSVAGMNSPLKGYEAGADPVVRAGTNGLFYYSGIVFDRGFGKPSAAFVSRFMDLNNNPSLKDRANPGAAEAFENGPIQFIDTVIVDDDPGEVVYDANGQAVLDGNGEPLKNADSNGFIDKPWLAVDIPRAEVPGGIRQETIRVPQAAHPDGYVDQTVDCGPVYMAYAQITGEDTTEINSQIMFASSYDCGKSWSTPNPIDGDDRTINQGTSIAVNPLTGDVLITWRQFSLATLKCTRGADFWEQNPEAWPVERFVLGGQLYQKEQALGIFRQPGRGNPWVLARESITAKLNTFAGADSNEIADMIEQADAKLIEAEWVYEDGSGGTQTRKGNSKNNGNSGGNGNGNGNSGGNGNGNGNSGGNGNGNSGVGNGNSNNEWTQLIQAMVDYNSGATGPGNCDAYLLGDGDPMSEMPEDMPDAIMVVKCPVDGSECSEPAEISTLVPFDQGTTLYTFRANSYPSMTFDDSGRAYVVWSSRKIPSETEEFGDSRVVVSTSIDGLSWTAAKPIDPRPVDMDELSSERGHQIQPTITFSRGELLLVYLDFRQDRSGVFERFIADYFVPGTDDDPSAVPQYRHTVDVRAAQADPGADPTFQSDASVLNSTQLSRYFNLLLPSDPNDSSAGAAREQIQYNPLNQPLFKGGTVPFIGDYIDVAAEPIFVPDGNGGWQYDFGTNDSPIYHAVWSDNRDVKGPPDGDWTNYIPPGDGGQSLFDPTQTVQACVPGEPDRTGMRNQNVYTSRISNGLITGIPENSKPLFADATTSFVVFAKYANNGLVQGADRFRDFNVYIDVDNLPAGVDASFSQFDFSQENKKRALSIGYNSSAVVTVFVTSEFEDQRFASVDVIVESADGALHSTATINPDPTNPLPLYSQERFTPDLLRDNEVDEFWNPEYFDGDLVQREDGSFLMFHDLDSDDPTLIDGGTTFSSTQLDYLNAALLQLSLSNPDVFNPGIYNPGIYNPGIYNPGIYNPGIYNPGIYNPGIYNPGIYNPGIYNPGIYNPGIYNPGIYNSTITDANYVVENNGDAAAAYNVNLRLDDLDTANFSYQLIVSKIYVTPVAEGCEIVGAPVQEVLVNNTNPVLNGNLLNVDSQDSFYLEPGEFGIVTLRAIPKEPEPGEPPVDPKTVFDDVSISVIPDALDEELVVAGETQPKPILEPSDDLESNPLGVLTAEVDSSIAGQAYSYQLVAEGGAGAQSWNLSGGSLPEGLSLLQSGLVDGVPLEAGTFAFTARVMDATQFSDKSFEITISAPDLAVNSLTNTPAIPNDLQLVTFQMQVENFGEAASDSTSVTLSINGTDFVVPVPALDSPLVGEDEGFEGEGNGNAALVSFTTSGPLPAGTYPVTATVNANSSLIESNYGNNAFTSSITVNVAPDLVLSGLTVEPGLPVSGENVLISANVTNNGGAVASDFLVAISIDGELLEEVPVTGGLGAGVTVPVSITQSGGFGSQSQAYSLSVTVDSGNEVFESDESAESNTQTSSFEVVDPLQITSAYRIESAPGINWDGANAAVPDGSHLATITSADENALILSMFQTSEYWIGGFKSSPESEAIQAPGEDWNWVNNEGCIPAKLTQDPESLTNGCLGFSQWNGGEPSAPGQGEPHLGITQFGWNDEQNTGNISGYVIEFSNTIEGTLILETGLLGTTYSNLRLGATGGLADRSWSITSGSLPPGLTLSSDGTISGVSLTTGTYQFTLNVISGGLVAEQQASLVVSENPATEPVIGEWVEVGSLLSPLRDQTASLLPDGRVLLVGGTGAGFGTSGAVLYDASARVFTAGPETVFAHGQGARATTLADGRVLITGGNAGGANAEIFNPATGVFTSAGSMVVQPREYHSATLMTDGRVLIAGGFSDIEGDRLTISSAEIYDPVTDTFSLLGSLLDQDRAAHGAVLLQSGDVAIMGGLVSTTPGNASISNSVEIFDPVTDSFSQIAASMPASGSNFLAEPVLLNDGRVYYAANSNAVLFDPVAATLTLASSESGNGCNSCSLTLLEDGRVLQAGGYVFIDGASTVSTAKIFDPTTDSFTNVSSMNYSRQQHSATLLQNGLIMVSGGSSFAEEGELVTAEVFWPYPPPEPNVTAWLGSNPGGQEQPIVSCPAGQVAVGMEARYDPSGDQGLYNSRTYTAALKCAAVDQNWNFGSSTTTSFIEYWGSEFDTAALGYICNSGEIMVGVLGTRGLDTSGYQNPNTFEGLICQSKSGLIRIEEEGVVKGPARPTLSPVPLETLQCANGTAVVSIEGWTAAWMDRFRFSCDDPNAVLP